MAISFFSSKDSEETRTMYSKSDNIEVLKQMKSLKSFLTFFYKDLEESMKKNLEESMRGNEFVLDSVNSLYYELHKISLNRGGSYG